VPIKSRVVQDLRTTSRVIARLNCSYVHSGLSREAVLLNISLRGALLSSRFLPPINDTVVLTVRMPASNDILNLEGKVTRGVRGQSEHGAVGKLSVRFAKPPLQLLSLISSLK
jgi:hypothetical protein